MSGHFDFNNISQRAAEAPPPTSSNNLNATGSPHSPSGRFHGNVTVYQTTGPDAHTGPIYTPGTNTPALNPRSCVTCRRRKVRCDKQMPCSNCRRAQIPCVFPAPGRAPRQQRPRDPNAPPRNSSQREVELVKRLRKLEGIVEELSGQLEAESGGRSSAGASPDAGSSNRHMSNSLDSYATSPKDTESSVDPSDKSALQKSFGRLVLDEKKSNARYISSGFWAKLNDELDALRNETQKLATEDDFEESDYEESPTESPNSISMTADHHGFIFGYKSSDVNLKECHPLPAHSTFLWSVYQENVEPLLKILHIPTADLILREARKGSHKLSPAHEALVFAIYHGAVTSLEPEEVQTNFGASKDDLLNRYRFALEQGLAKANFMDTSDITVMQALAIFLIVVRRHDDSRFCWSLTGLLIRIAQGLGYHRDGSNFKLRPYEVEMRRRLWWAVLVLDLRFAEELGTDISIDDTCYDTLMPTNINDADISPDSEEYPEPREGRSDTAVSIVRYEITTLCRRIISATMSAPPLKPGENPAVDEREGMLIEVYSRIEGRFLQHVMDEADPLYWVAAMIARIIMSKMCLVIYQPMLFPGAQVELSRDVRHRLFIAAIEIVEYSFKLNTDPRCKQYRWLFMTYRNWHAVAYTLIETCRRPWTALVERGWQAVNGYEKDPADMGPRADLAAAFLPLRKLFAKARKHRESEVARFKANPDEARKLDFAERMNPEQSRFGPVPGAENRMEVVRSQWLVLVRPDGVSPQPFTDFTTRQRTPQPPQEHQGHLVPPMGASYQPQQVVQGQLPADVTAQLNFSNAQMAYMDQLMAQPNVAVADFWPVTHPGMSSAGIPVHDHSVPVTIGGATMNPQEAIRQQAIKATSQPIKDDSVPQYLWSDPFTGMNQKFDDQHPAEDTDMLGPDFDWQDWSQSIRGLEMESTQQPKGW